MGMGPPYVTSRLNNTRQHATRDESIQTAHYLNIINNQKRQKFPRMKSEQCNTTLQLSSKLMHASSTSFRRLPNQERPKSSIQHQPGVERVGLVVPRSSMSKMAKSKSKLRETYGNSTTNLDSDYAQTLLPRPLDIKHQRDSSMSSALAPKSPIGKTPQQRSVVPVQPQAAKQLNILTQSVSHS